MHSSLFDKIVLAYVVTWCYGVTTNREIAVAYFLKKSTNKKGLYLQIYESFYDPARKHTAHRSVEAIGYEHELRDQGIDDPIAHFKAKVDEMNAERKVQKQDEKARRISQATPERYLGYFPFKALDSLLDIKRELQWLQVISDFKFSLSDLLSSLVYARLCQPCSKAKTFHDVLPLLMEKNSFSLDQMYAGIEFLGAESTKVIEVYNHAIERLWPRNTSRTYFDCTNFYFEIDSEDDLRRKGPSKENRREPIVGLGLLLDADCIPIGMKVFPGNESEKPIIKQVIDDMRRRTDVAGKVIRVADKGLNCADNVADAVLCGDGYVFSKSLKQLSQIDADVAIGEGEWVDVCDMAGEVRYSYKEMVDEFDYSITDVSGKKKKVALREKRITTFNPKLAKKQRGEIDRQVEKARRLRVGGAKRSEFGDSAKYVTFTAVDTDGCESKDKVVSTLNHAAVERARKLAGYNMLVTSEVSMPAREVYDVYHNLWKIEESFRVMKSQLDARPVYLQKHDSIIGHFLICYLAVLLLRLLQTKVLEGKYCSEEVMTFARGFRVVEASENRYINLSKSSKIINDLEQISSQPIGNYYLKKSDINSIMKTTLKLPVNVVP